MLLKKIFPLTFVASILLTGCATDVKDCDPNTGDVSIVTKFNCQYSGTYQKRVDNKKIVLENETALNAEFKSVMEDLQNQIALQQTDINQANKTNNALKSRLNSILADLKSKTTDDAALQQRIGDIQDEIENANPNASVIEKQLQLEELKSKLSSLEQDLGFGA